MIDDYFVIGKIVNTVGIAGEIKVFPITDDAKRFDLLDTISVMLNNQLIDIPIKKVRYHRNLVMLKLQGIDSIDQANELRGGDIVVERARALPLADNEYYLKDLIGMSVSTKNGENLGILTDVLFTGANDVYVIKGDNRPDILIPAISDCILSVDIKNQQMVVGLLEGLVP